VKERFDVVGIGYSSVDYLGIVPHYPPDADEKTELLEFSMQGGGPTATALVTLSRLGAKTAFIGKVGDDDFGDFMLRELQREGVDTSMTLIERGTRSPFAFIIVERGTGRRTILWTRSTASELSPMEVDMALATSARMLYLDGLQMTASIEAAKLARRKGITVFLDADTVWERSEELIKLCDVVIASKSFARQFIGYDDRKEAIKRILSLGPKVVGVTLGEEGCLCSDGAEIVHEPAFKVEVVDTTGAGDVFHGAFAYGMLSGWDLKRIARFANAVAALKCRKLGGRAGIPTFEEVRDFLGWTDVQPFRS
jgi:ribokinase